MAITPEKFQLTSRDREVLAGVHPELAKIVSTAAILMAERHDVVPFVVFEGVRTKQRQAAYVKKGVSRTMRSYHLVGLAVDLVPLLKDARGKLQPTWNVEACRQIAMVMHNARALLAASMPSIPTITWGGTWKFFDGPHFQLNVPYAAHPVTERYIENGYKSVKGLDAVPALGTLTKSEPVPDTPANTATRESTSVIQSHINALRIAPLRLSGTEAGIISRIPFIVVDGKYGKKTEKAVKAVQALLQIEADGLWGPKTDRMFKMFMRERKLVMGAPTKTPASAPTSNEPRVYIDPSVTLLQAAPEAVTPSVQSATEPTESGIMNALSGRKTYIAAALVLLGSVGSYMQGELTLYQLVALLANSVFAATLRSGINSAVAKITKLG